MKNQTILGIAILVTIFLLGISVGKNLQNPTVTNVTKVDTIFRIDTTIYTIVNKPTQVIKEIVYKSLPVVVDTQAILKDYYAYHPVQRIWNNDSIVICLNDTLTQNKVLNSEISYSYKVPCITIIKENTITIQPKSFVSLDIIATQKNDLGFCLNYNFPNHSYGIYYDPFIHNVGFKLGFKLFNVK